MRASRAATSIAAGSGATRTRARSIPVRRPSAARRRRVAPTCVLRQDDDPIALGDQPRQLGREESVLLEETLDRAAAAERADERHGAVPRGKQLHPDALRIRRRRAGEERGRLGPLLASAQRKPQLREEAVSGIVDARVLESIEATDVGDILIGELHPLIQELRPLARMPQPGTAHSPPG